MSSHCCNCSFYTSNDSPFCSISDGGEDKNDDEGDGDDESKGDDGGDDESKDGSEDGGVGGGRSLGTRVLWTWEKRKGKLEHEYAIAAWALCVKPEVMADVVGRLDDHRNSIESVVRRLHLPPCPNTNPKVAKMTLDQVTDRFWDEFKAFTTKSDPFDNAGRWASPNVSAGRCHLWHEKYSLPHTDVLGFVACRVTSKLNGIGPGERAWGDVKHIKSGKRSHLSAKSTEQRAVIYTSARIDEARIRRQHMERIDAEGPSAMFGNDDLA